jgi:hypothetical protein
LDAAVLMDIGWDKLRELLEPTQRSYRVITNGGDQPMSFRIARRSGGFFVKPRLRDTGAV